MSRRLHPHVVVEMPSRYAFDRVSGIPLELIVIHDAEAHNIPGTADLKGIGRWFQRAPTPSDSGSSAHVCTDGDGNSGRYVIDRKKAWACGQYNSASLNLEQM